MPTLAALAASSPLRRGDSGETVTLLQLALRAAGAELIVDGNFGPMTEAAVKRYQAAHAVMPDGIVGKLTGRLLDDTAAAATYPTTQLQSTKAVAPWLSTMRAITGNAEIPGDKDSPFVLGMAAEIGRRFPDLAAYCREYTHDAIPWCGLTIAYVMATNGILPVTKMDGAQYGFLWADDWRYFGVEVKPQLGAVMVFTRNGGGHVSLYEGEDGDNFLIRGGNQSDAINVISYPKDRLTTARWPKAFPVA